MTDASRRLASLHDARETFFKGLKNHEHTIYQLGYEDGFSAGWEAAVNRLSEVKPGAVSQGAVQGSDQHPAAGAGGNPGSRNADDHH